MEEREREREREKITSYINAQDDCSAVCMNDIQQSGGKHIIADRSVRVMTMMTSRGVVLLRSYGTLIFLLTPSPTSISRSIHLLILKPILVTQRFSHHLPHVLSMCIGASPEAVKMCHASLPQNGRLLDLTCILVNV